MKIAIVDDEKFMTDQIEDFLKRFEKETSTGCDTRVYHSGSDFIQAFERDFDLILLDVEMPGLNGIDTAREIRKKDQKVVIMFITNMAQYAIHGYEVEAVDYVLKPVTYQDFALKIKKAMRYVGQNTEQQLIIKTADEKKVLKISDIYYIEVIRHYLNYHTLTGVYETRGVMKEQEQLLLKHNFVRCSQSYLVNLAHVKALQGNDVVVGTDTIPMSRNKKAEFIDAFAKYVGGIS